ncbi:MAG: ATP-binding protein [Candidatus Omnitrophota bacterium]
MDILNKPIKTFSFDEIANFCAQRHVEGLQVDYKREIPVKGLAKHFAAFSNTRGGVIIVGVEEDKSTGVPKIWTGVKNEGKLVDRIHQFAANVEPLPSYEVHITDEKDGNVFLLVHIFEGDTTPYYVQNDANLWVRTGNISNPIDIASVDAIELLFGKKEKAKLAREIYIKKAQDVYQAALTRAEEERKRMMVGQTGELKYYQKILGSDVTPCTVIVQPFYPAKALTTPQEIRPFLEEINDRNRWRDKFPSMKMEPIPDGLLGFEWGYGDGSIECSQIYANGLVYNLLDVLNVSSEGKIIWISAIAQNLFMVLKIAGDFYRLVGYQGGLTAILSLKNTRGALLRRLAPSRWILYNRDKQSLLPDYSWNFELDTALLNHDNNFQDFYINMIRSIYWSLGYEPAKEEVYKAYLKECGWLVEG